jgi:hypothetical protein
VIAFMFRLSVLSLLAALLAAGGCAHGVGPNGTVIYFQERQGGGEAWSTRMLLTPAYLRIDDGKDDADFVLLDRRARAIYNVNHGDKTVLVVRARPVAATPPQPFVAETKRDDETYPAIGGRRVLHYELFSNHARCYDVYAAPGLLPDAVEALREFAQTLAGEQASTLAYTPKEMQAACMLANNVFLPTRHLEFGFPVRQEDMAGNERQLVNYDENRILSPTLFQLPADFRRYSLSDLRGGAQ